MKSNQKNIIETIIQTKNRTINRMWRMYFFYRFKNIQQFFIWFDYYFNVDNQNEFFLSKSLIKNRINIMTTIISNISNTLNKWNYNLIKTMWINVLINLIEFFLLRHDFQKQTVYLRRIQKKIISKFCSKIFTQIYNNIFKMNIKISKFFTINKFILCSFFYLISNHQRNRNVSFFETI